jgi:glycosyltransferase involved in cell wall biosynthesis
MRLVRCALYHPWVYLRGGAERVALEIARRSAHDWTILTHFFDAAGTFPEFTSVDVGELRPRVSVRRSIGPLLGAAAVISASRLPDIGASALLVSSEGLGDFVLSRNRLPAVGFCHTPLKILHDPVTRRRLMERSPAKAAALSVFGPAFAAADRRLWRRYRHAFANSEEVRRRLEAAKLAPTGPLEVLHPGVDLERFSGHEPAGGRQRVFLVAGRVMWQKNVELAIDAFRSARSQGLDGRMIVAGTVDAKSEDYLRMLRDRAEGLPVTFETDVADARLAELLSSCFAVVHPSPNEDFGITPVEAMAAGAPVIAVDAGGTRETVVDGETGWLVPADTDHFAAALLSVARAGDGLDAMRAAARRRAAQFTWAPFVARVDDVMEKVAAGEPAAAP